MKYIAYLCFAVALVFAQLSIRTQRETIALKDEAIGMLSRTIAAKDRELDTLRARCSTVPRPGARRLLKNGLEGVARPIKNAPEFGWTIVTREYK